MTLNLRAADRIVWISACNRGRRVDGLSWVFEACGSRDYLAGVVVKWELLYCRCIVDVRYVVEKREMVG